MSREYRFDRYWKGRKMAEGLVLTKPTTVEQAMETVYLLAGPSDTFVLREDLACLAAVEAERDAARAGEARAVEALQNLRIPLAQLGDFMYSPVRDASQELLAIVNSVLANTYAQPALDWLAEQRTEAAAKENDRWANEWWELARPTSLTVSDFTKRAAALRTGEVGND